MIGDKIIEEKILTLTEVKDMLKERKKQSDLNYEQEQAYDYAKNFSKLTKTKAEKLISDLKEIEGMNTEIAINIVNILPTEKEILSLLIPKDSEIKQENFSKIIELVKKHGGKELSERAKTASETAKSVQKKAKEEAEKAKKEETKTKEKKTTKKTK